MAKINLINVSNEDTLLSIRTILKSVLATDDIEAILVPGEFGKHTMPVLITEPELLDTIDPLAPAFVMNGAKLVSKLTHKPLGKKIAVVLRNCEIRALVELIKLKQASTDDIVIIGIDCLGTFTNKDMARLAESDIPDLTRQFCETMLAGENLPFKDVNIATACRACENPVPENADILIGLFGMDIKKQLLIKASTEKGEEVLNNLSIPEIKETDQEPADRKDSIKKFIAKKIEFRDQMFAETKEATHTLEKLADYFSGCINCYNCRVACPVCYCRECVFNTDVFNHDPYQYIQWAKRKGSVKMPADTSFYHITRLAHMSLACVGCGQCSNACPNDIPVMELFKYVSGNTQAAFEYEAGKDMNQPPPLSVFNEKEYLDVVGIN